MLNNSKIRIQEPIHAILRARILALIQLPTANRPRHAFLPAYICEGMDGYTTSTN